MAKKNPPFENTGSAYKYMDALERNNTKVTSINGK